MAAYALLVGTKGDNRSLIADGDPRVIRRRFKLGEFPEGFDRIEVVDTSQGRVRSKWLNKPTAKTKTPEDPRIKTPTEDQPDPTAKKAAKKAAKTG